MKIRSLKQTLHWLFLAVGIISIILLAISASTYFGYAEEGYGVDLDLEEVNLAESNHQFWLGFDFSIENPGRLVIDLQTATLTIGAAEYALPPDDPYGLAQSSFPISELPKKDTTAVVVWFSISELQYNQIEVSGNVGIILDMEIYVPERHCTTHLIFDKPVEVSIGA